MSVEAFFDRLAGLALPDAPVVVDGGANKGRVAARFLAELPGCRVEAFEPQPGLARKLAKRFAHEPRLTVHATVVSKRQNTSVHHHHNDNTAMHTSTSTSYYATFQFDSGDRLELHVSGPDYGLLAEGDTGDLTFQGTRYLGFDRRAAGPAPEDELSTDAPHRPTEKKSWDPEL